MYEQNGTCHWEKTGDAFMRFKSPKRSISSVMHYSPVARGALNVLCVPALLLLLLYTYVSRLLILLHSTPQFDSILLSKPTKLQMHKLLSARNLNDERKRREEKYMYSAAIFAIWGPTIVVYYRFLCNGNHGE